MLQHGLVQQASAAAFWHRLMSAFLAISVVTFFVVVRLAGHF